LETTPHDTQINRFAKTRSSSIPYSETTFPSPAFTPAEIRGTNLTANATEAKQVGVPLPQPPPGQQETLLRTAPRRRGSRRSHAAAASSVPSRSHSVSSPLRRSPPMPSSTTMTRRFCCSQIPSPPHTTLAPQRSTDRARPPAIVPRSTPRSSRGRLREASAAVASLPAQRFRCSLA
jgi:hypothetical protein